MGGILVQPVAGPADRRAAVADGGDAGAGAARVVRPEVVIMKPTASAGHAGADRLTRGDAIEIAGLALGAGLLALVLACTYGRQVLEGWQPWARRSCSIVWASLRQGQRGGVLTAGLAAALPLVLPRPVSAAVPPPYAYLIQGNLLALVGAGLLAAAAAGWLRINEMRYRQVVDARAGRRLQRPIAARPRRPARPR